jgi:hypothetical protein
MNLLLARTRQKLTRAFYLSLKVMTADNDKKPRPQNILEALTEPDAGAHYRYEYRNIQIDPFRIADVYGITDFAMQTILKKVLRAGRAHKDLEQDLKDIICAAQRKLEMLKEDSDYACIIRNN